MNVLNGYEIYVAAFQKLLQVTEILFLATIRYMRSNKLFHGYTF